MKAAEAALIKLLERERFMRMEGHAMALALYERMGDSEKARKHRDFLERLSSALFVPGHGTSFEKPFEVLFIEEEYTVLGAMGLKMKQQGLSERDGHRFDVLTTHAKRGEPERQFYFNIDMPWSALQASMQKAFDRSKEPAQKKKEQAQKKVAVGSRRRHFSINRSCVAMLLQKGGRALDVMGLVLGRKRKPQPCCQRRHARRANGDGQVAVCLEYSRGGQRPAGLAHDDRHDRARGRLSTQRGGEPPGVLERFLSQRFVVFQDPERGRRGRHRRRRQTR